MNIAILGNEGSWYVDDLRRAAEERGHRCQRAEFRRLTSTVSNLSRSVSDEIGDLTECDAVIVRTMPPGSLEQVVYRMDALHQLQAAGVLVVNSPRAVETAVDKFLTTARVAAAGLPTPSTVVCEGWEQAIEAFQSLGGDVVVKPIFGSEGRGILRVSDLDLAHRVFRTLERTLSVLYLQQFIPHDGFDVRVLVLDGLVLGGMVRRNPSDFRTNVARTGQTEVHAPIARESDFALRAADAVGACFAGVDLLYDADGNPYVIEVNAVPGWRAFQRTTGIDVADHVIRYLERACNE